VRSVGQGKGLTAAYGVEKDPWCTINGVVAGTAAENLMVQTFLLFIIEPTSQSSSSTLVIPKPTAVP
jgi:hypothetical protein